MGRESNIVTSIFPPTGNDDLPGSSSFAAVKEENDLHKEHFAKLKSWIMSAPMSGVKLVDLTDGEDEAEISTPETAKNRKLFGKKPRAEFQQEIDDLEAANTQLTADNDRLKELISELRVWHCDIPV